MLSIDRVLIHTDINGMLSDWDVEAGADSKEILAADEYRDELTVQLHAMAVEGTDPVFLGFGEDAVTEEGLFLGGIGHAVRVLGAKARLAVNALSAAVASGGIETHTSLEYRHTLNYPEFVKPQQGGTGPTAVHFVPADDATSIATNFTPFMILFDMNVALGMGSLTLHKSIDDSLVHTFLHGDLTVDGATVSFAGAAMEAMTDYYMKADAGVLTNELADADWAGITDATTWNFRTA